MSPKRGFKAPRNQKVSYWLSQTSPQGIEEPKSHVLLVTNKPSRHTGTKKSRTSYPKQALKAFRSLKSSDRLSQTRPQSAQEPRSLVLVVPNKLPRHSGTKRSRVACHKQALKEPRKHRVSYFLSQPSPQGIHEPKSLVPFVPDDASKRPGSKQSRTGCPKQAPKALRNQKVT